MTSHGDPLWRPHHMAIIGLLFFQGADGIYVRSYPSLEYMLRVHKDDLAVQLQVNAL